VSVDRQVLLCVSVDAVGVCVAYLCLEVLDLLVQGGDGVVSGVVGRQRREHLTRQLLHLMMATTNAPRRTVRHLQQRDNGQNIKISRNGHWAQLLQLMTTRTRNGGLWWPLPSSPPSHEDHCHDVIMIMNMVIIVALTPAPLSSSRRAIA
jgi:hypothetical protein